LAISVSEPTASVVPERKIANADQRTPPSPNRWQSLEEIPMKFFLVSLATLVVSLPAYAALVPEIDGSLAIQFAALAAGLALLLKKKR
jgi:hypothetical protein